MSCRKVRVIMVLRLRLVYQCDLNAASNENLRLAHAIHLGAASILQARDVLLLLWASEG